MENKIINYQRQINGPDDEEAIMETISPETWDMLHEEAKDKFHPVYEKMWKGVIMENKQHTWKDLRDGKIAIKNDDRQKTIQLVNKSCPTDNPLMNPDKDCCYYSENGRWLPSYGIPNKVNLPIIPASEVSMEDEEDYTVTVKDENVYTSNDILPLPSNGKWAIERNEENYERVNRWANEQKGALYIHEGLNGYVFSDGTIPRLNLPEGYTLITTAQFDKYVLGREYVNHLQGRLLDQNIQNMQPEYNKIVSEAICYPDDTHTPGPIKYPFKDKEDRKIIGYRCPMFLKFGNVKAGTVFVKHELDGLYVENTDKIGVTVCSEIVETWEPVFEEQEEEPEQDSLEERVRILENKVNQLQNYHATFGR